MKLNSKYKAAIFDLDGTILDTLEDLTDAVNYALIENGQPGRSIDEVRRFVGNGIKNLIARAVQPGTDKESEEKIYADFMKYYKVHCADKTRPYKGIPELLTELKAKGIRIAVVSNKADSAVRSLCEQYFDGLFDYYVGEREGLAKKPAPDSVNEVLRKLKLDVSEAVYIGDSEVDIETAENVGMELIIVSWGFRGEEYLKSCGAGTIVHAPGEIVHLF
jgi:phosphoglycolate phosphatase